MSRCEMELCPNWTGHGCACEVLDLPRPAAEPAGDRCRLERVTVDGQDTTVVVHGGRPLDHADRAALGELVGAARDYLRRRPRHRAIGILVEHQRDGGRCRCGAAARLDQQHAAHLVDQLIAAGLLDATTAPGTSPPRTGTPSTRGGNG